MKVTDLYAVLNEIDIQLDETCPDLLDLLGRDCAKWCALAIYQTNDKTSAYGQDFNVTRWRDNVPELLKVSVISYKNGISVIVGRVSSRYQDNIDLCGYQDLTEDVHAILMYIQTAIERINANS